MVVMEEVVVAECNWMVKGVMGTEISCGTEKMLVKGRGCGCGSGNSYDGGVVVFE